MLKIAARVVAASTRMPQGGHPRSAAVAAVMRPAPKACAAAALILAALDPQSAWAMCLNPFGCEKLRGECVMQAGKAQTEAAAKAMIRQCNLLPEYPERECRRLSMEWGQYLQATGGREWNWPKLASKRECREHYPATFTAQTWVTASYCAANRERIEAATKQIDPATGRSRKLADGMAKSGGMDGLSDDSAVRVIQSVHYPKWTTQDLALAFFIDGPPDVHDVARACSAKNP